MWAVPTGNRKKNSRPVGSLFLRALDQGIERQNVNRSELAEKAIRSLPNTALSMYPDQPERTKLFDFGSSRRHFIKRSISPFDRDLPTCRRLVRRGPPECYSTQVDLNRSVSPQPEKRNSKRMCRKPPFTSRPYSAPRVRPRSSMRDGCLTLGTLIPTFVSPPRRTVPPPMELKPLRPGRRRCSLPATMTTNEKPEGVKRGYFDPNCCSNPDKVTHVPNHAGEDAAHPRRRASSVGSARSDCTEHASIHAAEVESSVSASRRGESKSLVRRANSDAPIACGRATSNASVRSDESAARSTRGSDTCSLAAASCRRSCVEPQCTTPARSPCTGRRRSATPTGRGYDIITWLPL
uniref:Uncharacterized protein n=1 Tax=Trypanosoma congolense (strain IL3000) TaxID=1068625 RepID=G0UNT1_TRYCI|nr:conserved hypothetical protein [Trypanosoma congolense IL3000]